MYFVRETARDPHRAAADEIRRVFGQRAAGLSDAVFTDASHKKAFGVAGLPWPCPAAGMLLADRPAAQKINSIRGPVLLTGGLHMYGTDGEISLKEEEKASIQAVLDRILEGPGSLNEKGELILDLKGAAVGPHYPVNLLLGDRRHSAWPLFTTPKSAVDALGRGSFRSVGGEQVLATRCVLDLSQNGEPENRQFYLFEDGKQIFYSADVQHNVRAARCVHSQDRTEIFYETEDGLAIKRTIFLLPQKDGLPNAVEVQQVHIKNTGDRARRLKIVMTGMFGIADATTVANDDVYANIVQESAVYYDGENCAAVSLNPKPEEERPKKRFAMLLCGGETMDDFSTSKEEFVGNGTLMHPDSCGNLTNRLSRKNAPFFAMGKMFDVEAGDTCEINEFVGMADEQIEDVPEADDALRNLYMFGKTQGAVSGALQDVKDFWNRYPQYLTPKTGDRRFDAYVGCNLPFQVLYQTYVSRAFAWTQKSYRETGFREIQDIYASMYYLSAIGEDKLVKEMLEQWIGQVWEMGYANHDFTFEGKEPGDCSDDQLWLVQAVYRYVQLTGDKDFLTEEFPIAGQTEKKRRLWDTIMAILIYSGCISVGKHGLPLLDKADWNDTLKLDPVVLKGPAKEKKYREQLAKKGQAYGAAWENTLSESCMNACLLKIAADEAAFLGNLIGETNDADKAKEIAQDTAQAMQVYAWKGDYFARCLINDGREGGYTYLGAKGDGLSLDPDVDGSYFLNSYSWAILSGIASEDQIRKMLAVVNRYLRTDAGLKLCTLIDYDRLGVKTGTALYFPGDRENSGVFKHAAMMATAASLKAAKKVQDPELSEQLADLAFFMIDRTLPYKAMDNPYVLKGNPRFCTQYNNSQTGEHVGPMLSGTASWLTLCMYEIFGVFAEGGTIHLDPVLRPGMKELSCFVRMGEAVYNIHVTSESGAIVSGTGTKYRLDGRPCGSVIRKEAAGEHTVEVVL